MAPVNILQSFFNVAQDFRKKIFLLLGILVAGSVIGYLNTQAVMRYLFEKVPTVIFTAPAEGFVTQIKLAIVMGLILTIPFILYIIIDFIAKKFPRLGIKNALIVTAFCYILFMVGVCFAFFFITPLAIKFLIIGYQTDFVAATMSAGKFISFVIMLTVVFGFAFELPVVTTLLSYAGLLKSQTMAKNRKFVVLGMFVLAALVTPPDVFSQVALAIPLLGLYEVSIYLAKVRERSLPKPKKITISPTGEMIVPEGYMEEYEKITKEALAEVGLTMEDVDRINRELFPLD